MLMDITKPKATSIMILIRTIEKTTEIPIPISQERILMTIKVDLLPDMW